MFRVMLAASIDDVKIDVTYPVLASPKLDGIRAYIRNGQVLSRSNKLIPNINVQTLYGRDDFCDLDGELIVKGAETSQDCFNQTTRAVMGRFNKTPVDFWVFDRIPSEAKQPFYERIRTLNAQRCPSIHIVEQTLIDSFEQLEVYEKQTLAAGYEGVMLRSCKGLYKHGRSTKREGWLLKLKRFVDAEATIVGVEELMHNNNELTFSLTGYAKRSSAQENKLPGNTLGALIVKCPSTGAVFNVGSGFTAAYRQLLWNNQEHLIGKVIKYKYQPIGVLNAPRIPIFLGIRHDLDK